MKRSTITTVGNIAAVVIIVGTACCAPAAGDDALERRASWQAYDATQIVTMLRSSLDELGVAPAEMDRVAEDFLAAVEQEDIDPLDAFIQSSRSLVPVVDELAADAEGSVAKAAAKVRNDHRQAAMDRRKAALDTARQQADGKLDEAMDALDTEASAARAELKARATELAQLFASRLLGREVSQ